MPLPHQRNLDGARNGWEHSTIPQKESNTLQHGGIYSFFANTASVCLSTTRCQDLHRYAHVPITTLKLLWHCTETDNPCKRLDIMLLIPAAILWILFELGEQFQNDSNLDAALALQDTSGPNLQVCIRPTFPWPTLAYHDVASTWIPRYCRIVYKLYPGVATPN